MQAVGLQTPAASRHSISPDGMEAVGAPSAQGWTAGLLRMWMRWRFPGTICTAGGVPENSLAQGDGAVWWARGWGVNSNVSALAVSGSVLYGGGIFRPAGGITANGIARWTGAVGHPWVQASAAAVRWGTLSML